MKSNLVRNLYQCNWSLKRALVNISIVLFLSIFLANHAIALQIIPYFTSGNGNATTSLTGPMPHLDGDPSPYAVDCSQMTPTIVSQWTLDNPGKALQTVAVCNAIKQWQTLLKDPVTLKIEFVARTDLPATLTGSIALTSQFVAFILPGKSEDAVSTNQAKTQVLAYQAMKNLLMNDNNADTTKYNLVNDLPNAQQFTSQNVLNTNFVPFGVYASLGQIRALGVDFPRDILPPVGRGILPGMDASIAYSTNFTYDYDPTDNIGIGPKSAAEWELIDLNSIPRIIDFTGVTLHEIGHVLGFISRVDSFPRVDSPFVSMLDLFRLRESDLPIIGKVVDFKNAPRNLLPQGDCSTATSQNPCNILASDVTKGNHVFVYDIVNGQAKYIPLSSGVFGDGFQASHLREPGNFVTNNGGLYIDFVDLPFLAINGPAGFLMEPGGASFMHVVLNITPDDLRVLDILGWSVNYSQLANVNANPTSLSQKAITADSYSMSMQGFLDTNGLSFELQTLTIEN